MSEIDIAVPRFASPMERLLYLRSTGYLSHLHGPALSSLAQRSRETFVRAGTILVSPDRPVKEVFFLAEGEVTVRVGDRVVQRLSPPGGVGFLAMLGPAARAGIAVAETNCVTLALDVSDVIEVFEEDYFFASATIRALAGTIADMQATLEAAGRLQRTEPETGERPPRELDFVQRLRRLRVGPYLQCTMDALADLAMRTEEVRYSPGDVIWREGEEGNWGLNLVYGIVVCQSESPPRRFRLGTDATVGTLQAQARQPRAYTCTAETDVVALRSDIEAMNDIIEDHPDLGLTFLSFMSDLVFGLSVRLAQQGIQPAKP